MHSVDNHSCDNQLVQLGQGDDTNVNHFFSALIRNSFYELRSFFYVADMTVLHKPDCEM